MQYNIYCLKENGVIRYIGCTTRELNIRFSEHVRRKFLNESEYNIELIEKVEDFESAKEKGEYYIEKYDTVDNGLNKTYGLGTKGLSANPTSFQKDNRYGECGTKPVRCLETGVEYESLTQCANSLNLSISKISAVCRGKRKTTGGYHFEFV